MRVWLHLALFVAVIVLALNAKPVWAQSCAVDEGVSAKLIDRLDTKQEQQDRHLEVTDARVSALSGEISTIKGVGAAVVGILTGLRLLGLLKSEAAAPKPE